MTPQPVSRVTEPLKLLRRRARSRAVFAARLTVTATASYLIALLVPGTTERPTLAPLTALLVLQVSLYRTLRSAVQRVGSVTGGVLVAVVLARVLGFSWWSLGLAIGAALVLRRRSRSSATRWAACSARWPAGSSPSFGSPGGRRHPVRAVDRAFRAESDTCPL